MARGIELNISILDTMDMGRPKKFNRDEVLEKAIPVFWEHGFADTSVQDLERATHVNKSGLYAEFENKKDIFLASLRHYLNNRGARKVLSREPLGWNNVESFLKIGQVCIWGKTGCFVINSIREWAILPPEALEMITENRVQLKRLLVRNIEAEQTQMDAEAIADMVMTFFTGLCLEQNYKAPADSPARKTENIMRIIRSC